MKKHLAALTAVLLAVGVSFGAAILPASATGNPPAPLPMDAYAVASPGTANQVGDWQTLTGEICVKTESPSSPYTLVAPPAGREYSKLIIKSGSTGNSVTSENYVWYPPHIVVGALYQHPEKDSISHLILCTIPTPTIPVTVAAPSFTPATCEADGTLVLPPVDHYTWTGDTAPGVGTHNLTAVADSGYSISGQSVFVVEVPAQLDGEECEEIIPVSVTAVPSATAPTCEADGTLVLPANDHITWTGDTAPGVGTHNLTAVPDSGYSITGQSVFVVEVLGQLDGEECDTTKTAGVIGDPEPTDALCPVDEESDATDGFYTVFEAEGVGYTVAFDGVFHSTITSSSPYTSIIVPVSSYPTTVTIDAFALPGYVLAPGTTHWEHEFEFNEEDCQLEPHALVTPEISTTPPTCTTSGSYTIGGDGVVWTLGVAGPVVPAGTYVVSSASTVTLVAAPGPGNGFEQFDQQTVWDLVFGAPVDCLDTLAFTGSEGVPLYLGGAAAMLLLGAASIFFTRRRSA